jgi:hypothetical protein
MNMIDRTALMCRMTCDRCHGARVIPGCFPPVCQQCQGEGAIDLMLDTTGIAFLGGAPTLPDFLSRLQELLTQCRLDEAKAEVEGNPELALIEAARRSGMAEIGSALCLWLTAKHLAASTFYRSRRRKAVS